MILIRNPTIQDIMAFCAFRNPSNAEARAERMKNNVLLGKTNLLDHWLLEQNQQVVAVWSLIAVGSIAPRGRVALSGRRTESCRFRARQSGLL